ncbi:MAG: 6-bladed beta-propeller [Bacteroidota bacterium]
MNSNHLITLALLFCCCQPNGESPNEENPVIHLSIDNSKIDFLSPVTIPHTVAIFTIEKELSYGIGSKFGDFYKINDLLLIVDRRASEITCIDTDGKVVWIPDPPSPEVERYTHIGTIDIDYDQKEIYIEDRLNLKIDVYAYDGRFLRSIPVNMGFMEYVVLGKNNLLFDISDVEPYRTAGDESPPMKFMHQKDNEVNFTGEMPTGVNYDAIPWNSRNRFNRIGSSIQHRRPWENEVFAIYPDYSSKKILEFKFARSSGFVDVANRPNIGDVRGKLVEEHLAIPNYLLYDQEQNRLYCGFWMNDVHYLSCTVGDQKIVQPAEFYRFNEFYLRAPEYYSDGQFFQQLFRYEFEYLQTAFKDQYSREKIRTDLAELEAQYGDNDDIFIIVIELR